LSNFGLTRLRWWPRASLSMATLVGLKMNTVPRGAPALIIYIIIIDNFFTSN